VGARAALLPVLPRGRRAPPRRAPRRAHAPRAHRDGGREPDLHPSPPLRRARGAPRPRERGPRRGGCGARLPVPAVRRLRRPDRRDARHLRRGARRRAARLALEWDLAILQHLTTPTTTEMPRGYELYQRRGGRLPEYAYEDWLEHVLLFDEPGGCAEKIARLRDAGVERLLLWMGPGGVPHDLLVR